MKHIALLTTLLLSASLQAVEKPYDYVFFENSLMKGDYFYSQAKYTSPSWIKNARHHLPVAGSVAFTPGNSLELTYVSAPGTSHRNNRKTKEFIFLIISYLHISYFLHFCPILPVFCYSVHF